MKLTVNSKAPTFSAPDQFGKVHSLEQYTGKWLLLYFYPKDDTPGCTAEACGFRDAMSDLLQHIVVLGISADSVASHQQFAQKYHLNYPILADPDKKMHIAYGTNGLVSNKRVSFLITPDGIIAKIYDKVNVNTHANDILQAVKHLYNETRNEKAH